MALTQSLQDNILTLLVFDKEHAPVIVNNVDPELFESSVYRTIAELAIDYFHKFNHPVANHLPDLLESQLKKGDQKSEIYSEVLSYLFEAKDTVHAEFSMKSLNDFLYQQNIKLTIAEAVSLLNTGKLEEAGAVMQTVKQKQLGVFDPGIRFAFDNHKIFRFMDRVDNFILTGIKELDALEICPAPKELYTFVGLSNRGKSWFLIHLAKMALLQRKKVLYITLEMSEDKVVQRILQSFFSITKRPEIELLRPYFQKDAMGHLSGIDFRKIKKTLLSFRDGDIKKIISTKLEDVPFSKRNLIIKEFPTGQLTIGQLKAYLTNLATFYNFHPDLVLLDYADLMHLDQERMRIDIGRTYKDLRGIAVELMLPLVTVSQTNREAMTLRWITSKNLAEDFSKLMISDNLITYNQTANEYTHGLARLFADKCRNDWREIKVLLAQNYAFGQFCLDSVRMFDRDWRTIEGVIAPETPQGETN